VTDDGAEDDTECPHCGEEGYKIVMDCAGNVYCDSCGEIVNNGLEVEKQ